MGFPTRITNVGSVSTSLLQSMTRNPSSHGSSRPLRCWTSGSTSRRSQKSSSWWRGMRTGLDARLIATSLYPRKRQSGSSRTSQSTTPILRSAGIDVPRIVTSPDDAVFPLFYKETSSSGSHNAHVIRTTAELQSALVEQAGMCIEYIEGREVTVDCFVSPEGQLLSFNIRTREKKLGGMAVICRNYTEPRLEPIVRQITTCYRFAGCINMQFMLTDERVVLIDLNTRYPSE